VVRGASQGKASHCSVSFTHHAGYLPRDGKQNHCTAFLATSNALAASGTSPPMCRAIAFLITAMAASFLSLFPPKVWAPALIYKRWPITAAMLEVRVTGGTFITPHRPFTGGWPKVAPIVTDLVTSKRPSPVNVRKWRFGRRKSNKMLSVDERQFELGYTPIACGLMALTVGCVLTSVVAAIWWFFFR